MVNKFTNFNSRFVDYNQIEDSAIITNLVIHNFFDLSKNCFYFDCFDFKFMEIDINFIRYCLVDSYFIKN